MAKRHGVSGHTGVQIRENGLVRIRVKHQGAWVWESVEYPATATGLKHAARIRQEVLDRERINALDWCNYFPHSVRCVEILQEHSVPTFGELATQWLRHRAADVSPSTYRGYRIRIDGFWRPTLGHMPIDRIRKSHVLDVAAAFGWSSGKTYSNALTPLRGVFELAIDDGLISINPAARIKPPKSQKEDPDPLSVSEMVAVLDSCAVIHPQWTPYFQVAFGSGMRTSELIGLFWSDIDRAEQTIRVCRSRVESQNKATTKTGVARTIPITPMAARGIRAQRAVTELHSEHVFLHPSTGKPIRGDEPPRRIWNACIKHAGIRHRKAYSTRHTFASLNLMEGKNIMQVSQWLGHKSTQMTYDHYARWIPDTEIEADSAEAFK